MAWEPDTGALWVAVNERDELGNDLVPDYMTAVRDGGFYGWPYSYFGAHVDERVKPQRPDLVAKAIVPDYALGAHTASLGLAERDRQRARRRSCGSGMFVGQHGSWNRKPRSGYKVIFVPFDERQAGRACPVDVLTGFVTDNGDAMGRPGGRGRRQPRRPAGGRRRRQHGVARDRRGPYYDHALNLRFFRFGGGRPAQRPDRGRVGRRCPCGVVRVERAIVELGTGRLRDAVVLGAMHAPREQRADRGRVIAAGRVAVEGGHTRRGG